MSTMVRVGVVLNLVAAAMAWLWACWVLPSWVRFCEWFASFEVRW